MKDEVIRFLESVEFHGQDISEEVHGCTLDELADQLVVLEEVNNSPGLGSPRRHHIGVANRLREIVSKP